MTAPVTGTLRRHIAPRQEGDGLEPAWSGRAIGRSDATEAPGAGNEPSRRRRQIHQGLAANAVDDTSCVGVIKFDPERWNAVGRLIELDQAQIEGTEGCDHYDFRPVEARGNKRQAGVRRVSNSGASSGPGCCEGSPISSTCDMPMSCRFGAGEVEFAERTESARPVAGTHRAAFQAGGRIRQRVDTPHGPEKVCCLLETGRRGLVIVGQWLADFGLARGFISDAKHGSGPGPASESRGRNRPRGG